MSRLRFSSGLLLALLGGELALAAEDIPLQCTAPTENTDGTPLTDLAGIRFYEGLTSGGPYTLVGESDTCATVVENRNPGTYFYVATAVNAAGAESEHSGEVSKTVTAPEPPTELTAVSGVVYSVIKIQDGFAMLAAGEVPPGTTCLDDNVNDRHAVPVAAVTRWYGSLANQPIKPLVVVADCT